MQKHMKLLNKCARMIYAEYGYKAEEGYDFSKATHPQEQNMFALAVRTRNFWKDEFDKGDN